MSSSLPILDTTPLALDPRTYSRALSCVHCGLCLPACPTYTTTGHEADSPRGRIQLMRGLADGVIQPSKSVDRHLDLCLDCRACETACPSGVVYHELIEETRHRMAARTKQTPSGRFMRWMFFNIFTHPTRLKLALLPARLLQKLRIYPLLRKTGVFNILPGNLRKMEQMLPADGRMWPAPAPTFTAATGSRKATVAFVPGCVGSVMFDRVNQQAIDLLSAAGADVMVVPSMKCCGAIHLHNAAEHPAADMARRNIDAVMAGKTVPDFITTTIAGCGAMLHEYDYLLRDDPQYAETSKQFATRVRDISQVLLELGPPPLLHEINETITYHDACHLAHAQRVTAEPRQLLAMIKGLKTVPLPESDMCCGAAGTYNLTQPEMATLLGQRKLEHIRSTGAPVCATGNVGCAMHIQSQANASAQPIRVVHPVELLHRAAFGDTGGSTRQSRQTDSP